MRITDKDVDELRDKYKNRKLHINEVLYLSKWYMDFWGSFNKLSGNLRVYWDGDVVKI